MHQLGVVTGEQRREDVFFFVGMVRAGNLLKKGFDGLGLLTAVRAVAIGIQPLEQIYQLGQMFVDLLMAGIKGLELFNVL
jgi:hypothetical protein